MKLFKRVIGNILATIAFLELMLIGQLFATLFLLTTNYLYIALMLLTTYIAAEFVMYFVAPHSRRFNKVK